MDVHASYMERYSRVSFKKAIVFYWTQNCTSVQNLQSLGFRQNLIKKIEGLSTLTTLTDLSLYDNQITKIEGLESLVNLE